MNVIINLQECTNNNLTLGEALYLLALSFNCPFKNSDLQKLRDMGVIKFTSYNARIDDCVITSAGKDLVAKLFPDTDEMKESKELDKKSVDYFEIADKLRKLYPEGRKPGTAYMWRDTTRVIAKRLLSTFKKYGISPTEEELITATKKYIDSFNGDYSYMQLLKYFICKQVVKEGTLEEVSQLASYLQNNEDAHQDTEWTTNLK